MTWKIISIYLLTMFKFIAGPLGGYAAGFHFLITISITVTGTMSSVFLFTFLGSSLKKHVIDRLFARRKKFTRRNRRFVMVWKKYGLKGVAFLTPLIFTPIGGTLLMASMGAPRNKVFISMFISALFWSVIFTTLIYTFGQEIIPGFMRPADLRQAISLSAG